MKTRSADTHPDMERMQFALLRRRTPSQRLAQTLAQSTTIMTLSRRAIRQAHPAASEDELRLLILAHVYGPELAQRVSTALAQRAQADHAD